MKNLFFNAHHAPLGAFATFTLGFPGANGGLGLELGKPAEQNVYIGLETTTPGRFQALPFYADAADNEAARFDVEKADGNAAAPRILAPFARDAVQRDFTVAADTWRAGDLRFTVYSPAGGVPDPQTASATELQQALLPAVFAELTVDNRAGKTARTAFFGYQGKDPYSQMRRLDDTTEGDVVGIANGLTTALAAREGEATSAQGFTIEDLLQPKVKANLGFGLGGTAALLFETPAGERRTFQVAICFYRGGVATSGWATHYLYTRWFGGLEDVATYALRHFGALRDACLAGNAEIADATHLNADQRFMLAHAIRAYNASTELLEREGEPIWVVNEGEYRMMNTFDLTVDHLYYELRRHPWAMRNVLDLFVSRYSYRDTVHFHGGENVHPGGLSFTHDMGVANCFSRQEYSSYELYDLDGCFSHMTHEQLVNWLCCAAAYVTHTGDWAWAEGHRQVFSDCLQSLLNRDNPDDSKRNGIMSLDSSRTVHGAEITTYDSLDVSLGQSRNNLYLGVKTWASYVILAPILKRLGEPEQAAVSLQQANRAADTLASRITAEGYIPAVIDEGNDSKIIPAIEGLIFPYICGCREALELGGPYGNLIAALNRHHDTVLQPGICLFPDGGWKISSTSDNSWLSKVYLCQHIARQILGRPWGKDGARADAAHVSWLLHETLSYWSWSDQIVAGEIKGSKYYPRGVTAILWLDEA